MFSSASTMPCKIVRVCKHSETVNITYRYAKERENERYALGKTLCTVCSKRLEQMFKEPGDVVFDMILPPLRGSDKQVAWAGKIRAERWKLFGSVLQRVSLGDPEDVLILPMYRALLAYAAMDSAKYWIDGRDFKSNHWGLKSDTEFFLKAPAYGTMVGEFSPYGRLKQFNQPLLNRIMQATLPENVAPVAELQAS